MADMMKKVPVREQEPKVRATNFEEVCLGYNKEVHTAEIRDAALGGHSRPAKKDDAAALCQNLFQCLYHKRKRPFPHG